MEIPLILSILILLAFLPEPKLKKFGKKYRLLKNILFIAAVSVMILLILSVLLK